MQKRTLFLVVGLALVLSACASKATPIPDTATPTIERSQPSPTAALPSPTATVPEPTESPTGSPTDTTALVDVPAGCSTYTLLPAPDAAALEAFPNNMEGDWAKGLDTAAITIVEYSDFQ